MLWHDRFVEYENEEALLDDLRPWHPHPIVMGGSLHLPHELRGDIS
jgi:hypothetical protein